MFLKSVPPVQWHTTATVLLLQPPESYAHEENPGSPEVGKHVPEQNRRPEIEARVCGENLLYHKGGISV